MSKHWFWGVARRKRCNWFSQKQIEMQSVCLLCQASILKLFLEREGSRKTIACQVATTNLFCDPLHPLFVSWFWVWGIPVREQTIERKDSRRWGVRGNKLITSRQCVRDNGASNASKIPVIWFKLCLRMPYLQVVAPGKPPRGLCCQ